MNYQQKYLKYKQKYLNLKNQSGGVKKRIIIKRIPLNPPSIDWYEYPFSFINNGDYILENIFKSIPNQPEMLKDVGEFPNNISEFIWGQLGENDEKDWLLLCKLNNDMYAYYKASCDYTGFDCQGGMDLYVSSKLDILINYAMGDYEYVSYINDTKSE